MLVFFKSTDFNRTQKPRVPDLGDSWEVNMLPLYSKEEGSYKHCLQKISLLATPVHDKDSNKNSHRTPFHIHFSPVSTSYVEEVGWQILDLDLVGTIFYYLASGFRRTSMELVTSLHTLTHFMPWWVEWFPGLLRSSASVSHSSACKEFQSDRPSPQGCKEARGLQLSRWASLILG